MSRKRAIILSNSSKLGDILTNNKIFHHFPDAEINAWRNGAISIEESETKNFQLEPPVTDYDLFSFFDSKVRESLKKKFEKPNFYLVEYNDESLFKKVLEIIPKEAEIDFSITSIADEKNFFKYLKKNIKKKHSNDN